MYNENFELALNFLFPSEGGYVNHKNDKGGPTNMGITQNTYNSYRKKHNLPYKDVAGITRSEAKQIYYENYWLASGADKIDDPKMAIVIFDTAVLHGPYSAKKYYSESGGEIDKYLELRKQFYDQKIIDDPTQSVFYAGWVNRVNNLKSYINKLEQNKEIYQTSDYSIECGIKTSWLEQVINNILRKFYNYGNRSLINNAADVSSDISECPGSLSLV